MVVSWCLCSCLSACLNLRTTARIWDKFLICTLYHWRPLEMLIFYFVQSRVTMWSTHKLAKCEWDCHHCHNAITTEKPVNNNRSLLQILLTVTVVMTDTEIITLTNSDIIEMYLFWYVNSECKVKIMPLETVCTPTQSGFPRLGWIQKGLQSGMSLRVVASTFSYIYIYMCVCVCVCVCFFFFFFL